MVDASKRASSGMTAQIAIFKYLLITVFTKLYGHFSPSSIHKSSATWFLYAAMLFD